MPFRYLSTRIGKYELGKTLGEGAFSKVKIARNVETGATVAIKVMHKDKILKLKMVQQIKREISSMKLVKHPYVVQLLEVMATKTKIYLVLEYVPGGELLNQITVQTRIKHDEARKYFQQLIDAVDYFHSRDVYHRDLKPNNLLVDANGNLKITDFGMSALHQQGGSDGLLHTACGTPSYAAPEVINGKGYDGASADIWSCGVILYMLMAGYLPFQEANTVALFRKILQAEFTCPPWFSPGAKRLITKILDPNPKTRITITHIRKDEWFRKGFSPAKFKEDVDVNLNDIDAVFSEADEQKVTGENNVKPASMNAFEIISLSRGLDLSGLFKTRKELSSEKEIRFTSKKPAKEILKSIEEAAKPLGFSVEKHDYKMKLHGDKYGKKGHLSLATEVLEVAPSFFMVEMQKNGGDTFEYNTFQKNLNKGLKDIVWPSKED